MFISPGSVQSAGSPTPTPPGTIDEKLFNGMSWRQIGPFRGGRALAIEGVVGEPDTYYFGAVAGGVWKTTDGGANWTPLFDKASISPSVRLAVAASDHNVVYVGTGEAAIRGNTTYGTGVFKSIDGGKTWENVGLKDTRQIGALIVDPRNRECSSRRGAGPCIWAESGTRNFSHNRRRQNLGKSFIAKMKTQAVSTSYSIRIIRTSCSRRFGRRGGSHGSSPVAVRAADYIDLKTTA